MLTVQPGLCGTWSEHKLLVFSHTGSYSKTGVCRGIPYFLIFDQKHTLMCFEQKYKKYQNFSGEILNFYS